MLQIFFSYLLMNRASQPDASAANGDDEETNCIPLQAKAIFYFSPSPLSNLLTKICNSTGLHCRTLGFRIGPLVVEMIDRGI
ncbi:hypothetical protein L1987_79866 [Smallanthus sonchifolius]|uniref:Uncharacterized protein n=1 Tax=Smallanthus sonchifolius TaxID=185202 RepID=A0ACB8YM60_9ASTR|nr:hypothetical protein L1987_79866 [Smallanthus sonchifolius]